MAMNEQFRYDFVKKQVVRLHNSTTFQGSMFTLICLSFALNIVDFQYHPSEGSELRMTFDYLNTVSNWIFLFEILVNIWANFLLPFLKDWGNLFDVGVIGLSFVMEWLNSAGDNRVTFLRIFRVFRVVRLVRRLGSLRVIITSVRNAVGPVMNAACVLALLWALWAVIAVQVRCDEPLYICFIPVHLLFPSFAMSENDNPIAHPSSTAVSRSRPREI